jgi:hypothetical protein
MYHYHQLINAPLAVPQAFPMDYNPQGRPSAVLTISNAAGINDLTKNARNKELEIISRYDI